MAPRGRFLDLEREDVLFFYGAYHQSDPTACSVATTHAIVFWPVFLVAALLLHLMAPFPHAAAVCGALYVGYCFLLDRAASSAGEQQLQLRVTAFHCRCSVHYSGYGGGSVRL